MHTRKLKSLLFLSTTSKHGRVQEQESVEPTAPRKLWVSSCS